jgi:glyoxylate reductase
MKIFVTGKIPNAGLDLLKKKHTVRVYPKHQMISRKELEKGVMWCDALLPLLTDKIDGKLMDLNKNLKVIANYAVGFNNIDVKAATQRSIPVTNTPGVLTDTVAEHALALLLAIARRIPESDVFTKKGKYKGWEPMLFLGTELKGKTLGIVGLGRIGSAVAQRAIQGFGMNVVYNKRSPDKKFEKKFGAKFVNLSTLMKNSNFISIHLPLNPKTRHFVGKKQIGMMKKTAYLINTSRGPVVDEKALVVALRGKKIQGAALDVLENEPKLSPGLNKLSNVVLTPHTASATIETRSAMAILAARNILEVLSGKKPSHCVNAEVYGK